jgi:HRDC domain
MMLFKPALPHEPGDTKGEQVTTKGGIRHQTATPFRHSSATEMTPRRKSPAGKSPAFKRKKKAAKKRTTPAVRTPASAVKNEAPSSTPSSARTPISATSSPPPRDKYELAPTGRAKCQKCGKKIAIDSRRVGIHETSPRFGDIHRYYHDECFPAKQNLRLGGSTPQQIIAQQLRERNQGIMAVRERQTLRESLVLLRSMFAQRLKYAPFLVLPDSTLDELVIKMPRTKEEFMAIKGVGPKKYQSFGEPFLQVINLFRTLEHTPTPSSAEPDTKVQPRKKSRLSKTTPEVIDLVGDDGNDEVQQQQKRSSVQFAAPARTSADLDDEALVMETLTIKQIVEQKFKHAQENGYVIAVDI